MQTRRPFLTFILVVALIFNGTVSVLAASWTASQAQQYASGDEMLICTGNTFKWISQRAFLETGEFVPIEPPADAPAQISEVDCSNQYLSDLQTDNSFVVSIPENDLVARAKTLRLAQRPYTAFPYQKAQSRAPPLL